MIQNQRERGRFYPQGLFGKCLELFLVVTIWEGSATGTQWVEASDATKHTTVYRTAPTTSDYLTPNVSCAEVEKHAVAEETHIE